MTTIIFPILTFSVVFILGITAGIFISKILEKHQMKKNKDGLNFIHKDSNGNLIRIPIQNHTNSIENNVPKNKSLFSMRKTKIKLNKYELDYLLKQIEKHLNTISETYEENEHVKDLFENLIKSKPIKKSKNQKKDVN